MDTLACDSHDQIVACVYVYLGGDQDDRLALSLLLALNDIEHLGILLLEAAVEELFIERERKRRQRKILLEQNG